MGVQLTDRELDIMAALWHEGPSTAAQVRECLRRDGVDFAHNTVLTILRILENKGHVDHSVEGHTHRFQPLVAQHGVGVSALTRTVDHLFDEQFGLGGATDTATEGEP